jgi:leucine dehydrogenase
LFDTMNAEDHEQVVFCRDRETGLGAIIAIHDTTLGPSLGGIRMRRYSAEGEALADVLRLSQAMTYKASVAGLDFGGGKAVILGVPPPDRRPMWFRAMGRFVDSLGGRYIPTEDMGTFTADIERLRESTRYGVGVSNERGGGGDPSPVTAWGVLCGMRATLEAAGLSGDLHAKRVAVQGVGKVGMALVRYLLEAGAEVAVSDVDPVRLAEASHLGARVVENDSIHCEPCDVFAPCAAGGVLNERSIPELRCRAIAGGANNQLSTEADDDRLHACGILYAPDFAVNAGGLINVADELSPGGYSRARALAKTEEIGPRLRQIFAESMRTRLAPGAIALRLARERIERARSTA